MSTSCVSHLWMRDATYMNESFATCKWGMSHMWMSHVEYVNETRLTHEWFISFIWLSRITRVNEACHTYEWVVSHIWISHVDCMSYHTYEWVMPHVRMSHVSHVTHHVTHKKWVMPAVCHTYICVCPNMASISHHHLRGYCIRICMYIYIYISPLFACILIYKYIHKYITVWVNIICMYMYIYVYICTDIFIYIYTYIYIKIRYVSANTASDMCLQIRHQDRITSSSAWMLFSMVCSEGQRQHHCHMCNPPSLFTPALSARSSPFHQFVCVSYCIHICTHTLAWWPPTHSKWVLVCMLTNTQTKHKELNQKRERQKETKRKCEGGGRWK